MSLLAFGIALPWLIVAVGCWLGFLLLRQSGRILLRLEGLERKLAQLSRAAAPDSPPGLPVGAAAPEFELPDLAGGRKALSDFRGRRLLLIFFNPRCGFCAQMAPDLAALAVDGAGRRPLPLVVSTGAVAANREFIAEQGIRCPILLQEGMEIASTYQANGTPMGYLIDAQGRIASEIAVGAPALLALAEDGGRETGDGNRNGRAALGGTRPVAESKINRSGLPVGTPAPPFRLPRLDGGELSLEEYRGRRVLLVFSEPNCGPCDQLAPFVEQTARRISGIQVLMVSRGDVAANRAKAAQHGLTFPIVLQRQWEISREYGTFATPVAYLIDEAGLIAADVAVGVEPIRALTAAGAARSNGKGGMRMRR